MPILDSTIQTKNALVAAILGSTSYRNFFNEPAKRPTLKHFSTFVFETLYHQVVPSILNIATELQTQSVNIRNLPWRQMMVSLAILAISTRIYAAVPMQDSKRVAEVEARAVQLN